MGEHKDWGNILVRIDKGKTRVALDGLGKIYKSLNPGFTFTYSFTDADYNKLYQSEQLLGKLSGYFSFLAIFISCLGLLGLTMFSAAQRTKEIGVRKVLGAKVSSIFTLLAKEFIQLVIIAFVIATPIAWLLINSWLRGYAYKIQISWWVFAVAGLAAVVIALGTVSYQAIKAAVANPVDSLRSE